MGDKQMKVPQQPSCHTHRQKRKKKKKEKKKRKSRSIAEPQFRGRKGWNESPFIAFSLSMARAGEVATDVLKSKVKTERNATVRGA